MKPWQKGYELDFLKEKAARFKDYNVFSLSPFSEINPMGIAYCEDRGWFEERGDAIITKRVITTKRKITCDGFITIGEKLKGDWLVDTMSGPAPLLIELLNEIKGSCWLVIFEENEEHRKIASESGFNYVGSKISSFAEIYGYYFRDSATTFYPREHPKVPEYEKYALRKLNIEWEFSKLIHEALDAIKNRLEVLPEFTNHYSNYNAKGAWSALSLRGYRPDPTFITKPIEMNKKWQAENPGCLKWEIEDTPLRKDFPEIETLMNLLPGDKHRIRLMKLKSGGGELRRHTDLVDPDQGLSDEKLARIHFPVVTNKNVIFENWNWQGNHAPVNMKVGEAWYLDVRKPHRAINEGDAERIHIVVDVVSNQQLRNLIC